jgi:hypothetical protein
MLLYGLVGRLLIVNPVSHEAIYLLVKLVQQVGHLGRILDRTISNLGGKYAPIHKQIA